MRFRAPFTMPLVVTSVTVICAAALSQGGQGGLGGGGMGGFAGGQGGRAGASEVEGDLASYNHILTPGDRGEWPLTVREGETIIVRANSTVFDPAIELVDGTGKLLAKNDDIRPGLQDALILHRFTRAGSYKLLVKAFKSAAGGQYRITFRRFVPEETRLAERTAGPMGKSGVKWFRLPAQAGQTLVVTARASAFNPEIRVFAPTGEVLSAESATLGDDRVRRLIFRAESTGDYFARLGTAMNETDSYALTVGAARVIPAELGAANPARTLDSGSLDLWTFTGAAGDLVLFEARGRGAMVSSSLEHLPDPARQGEEAAPPRREAIAFLPSDPKSMGSVVALLKRPGKYQLSVSQPLGLPTEYTVTTTKTTRAWADGSPAAGELRRGESEYWFLPGKKGQIVQIEGAAEQFDLSLGLYDTQGDLVLSNDDGGTSRNALMTAMLSQAGRYLVRVHAYGNGGSGPYSLKRTNDPVRALSEGVRSEGRIGAGATEIWSFAGRAGQTIILSARSTEFDTHVQLFGPDGLAVAANDDGGDGTDSLVSVRLPIDGAYTAWVYGKQGGGRYAIRWLDLDR